MFWIGGRQYGRWRGAGAFGGEVGKGEMGRERQRETELNKK